MEDDTSEQDGGERGKSFMSFSMLFSVINAQVSRKEMTSFAPPSETNPQLLQIEWAGEGEPHRLVQKQVLEGSENSAHLTIRQPGFPLGMSGMRRSGVQYII